MSQHGLLQRQQLVHHRVQLAGLAAVNSSAITARRPGSGTVSALKVANDIDFWNAANISIPSRRRITPTTPTATMRPFGLSLAKNEGISAPATMSMMT